MTRAPCMGCQLRRVGCHSTCEAYLEYKADCEARRRVADIEAQGKHRSPMIQSIEKQRTKSAKRGRRY